MSYCAGIESCHVNSEWFKYRPMGTLSLVVCQILIKFVGCVFNFKPDVRRGLETFISPFN